MGLNYVGSKSPATPTHSNIDRLQKKSYSKFIDEADVPKPLSNRRHRDIVNKYKNNRKIIGDSSIHSSTMMKSTSNATNQVPTSNLKLYIYSL